MSKRKIMRCVVCGVILPPRKRKYCPACVRAAKARKRRIRYAGTLDPLPQIRCVVCNMMVTPQRKTQVTCAKPECRTGRNLQKALKRSEREKRRRRNNKVQALRRKKEAEAERKFVEEMKHAAKRSFTTSDLQATPPEKWPGLFRAFAIGKYEYVGGTR